MRVADIDKDQLEINHIELNDHISVDFSDILSNFVPQIVQIVSAF